MHPVSFLTKTLIVINGLQDCGSLGFSEGRPDVGRPVQMDILDGGKVILTLTYRQGKVQEI